MTSRLAAVALVAAACSSSPSTADTVADPPSHTGDPVATAIDASVAAEPSTSMNDVGWSEDEDGLRIKLELPDDLTAGTDLPAKLHFRNETDEPIRIYLVTADAFRGHQSVFSVASTSTNEVVSFQPEPRPHGIVVGEQDFPLLPPRSTTTFEQTLSLRGDAFAKGGGYTITWTYSNAVNKWEGGAQTLDGPTVELFGGERIPHIWLGRVSTSTDVLVNPQNTP